MFYNPIEQLVLEQFSAEPPFGGSTFPSTLSSTLLSSARTESPVTRNPFNGILNPPRNQPVDWGMFRPILLFGQFQPHLRSQYSAQYNFTIERELTQRSETAGRLCRVPGSPAARDTRPELWKSPDLPGPPRRVGLLRHITPMIREWLILVAVPTLPTVPFRFIPGVLPVGIHLTMPYGIPATVTGPDTTPLTLVGLRNYSSPHCDPFTGTGCPQDGIPVFSSIFAQDTIANSAYNSLQASLDKRFAHGLQFTAAYTFSKSFDEASSFEGILNPIDPRISRSLSAFDARHRIVFSYYWELPFRHYGGFAGKVVEWTGRFPASRLFRPDFRSASHSLADNELMYSFDFELPGEPASGRPFRTMKPQSNGNYFFDPNSFTENATDNSQPPCSAGAVFGCYEPSSAGNYGECYAHDLLRAAYQQHRLRRTEDHSALGNQAR